ncbi:MAG: hypothetical protein K6T65_01575 [Peptococcaceae bacterium]|nr:hypothetical protein [Peptococcaceae bacterium]
MITIRFGVADVRSLRPGWSREKARDFLKKNRRFLEREIALAGIREIERRLPEEKVWTGACWGCVDSEACGFDPQKCPLAAAASNGSGKCVNWTEER